MTYFVVGTYRLDACNRHSRITGLVLNQPYSGYTVHKLEDLVGLARAGQLWVKLSCAGCPTVKVEIFWSDRYGHWVARTDADTVLCNNLDSLPIYQPSRVDSGVTYYGSCPL